LPILPIRAMLFHLPPKPAHLLKSRPWRLVKALLIRRHRLMFMSIKQRLCSEIDQLRYDVFDVYAIFGGWPVR